MTIRQNIKSTTTSKQIGGSVNFCVASKKLFDDVPTVLHIVYLCVCMYVDA